MCIGLPSSFLFSGAPSQIGTPDAIRCHGTRRRTQRTPANELSVLKLTDDERIHEDLPRPILGHDLSLQTHEQQQGAANQSSNLRHRDREKHKITPQGLVDD